MRRAARRLLEMSTARLLRFPKPSLVRVCPFVIDREQLRTALDAVEIGQQSRVRKIQRMRMLPVVLGDLVQPIHDGSVAHLDRQLAPAVQTSGREVDRAHDGTHPVREDHLAVEFQMLELVDLDPDVVEDAKPPDALDELLSLEGMGRTSHDMHFHAATRRSDQALDDDRVLEALVLDEQLVLRLVDESADSIPPGSGAPDEIALVARREGLPVPVGLEAVDDLAHVMAA